MRPVGPYGVLACARTRCSSGALLAGTPRRSARVAALLTTVPPPPPPSRPPPVRVRPPCLAPVQHAQLEQHSVMAGRGHRAVSPRPCLASPRAWPRPGPRQGRRGRGLAGQPRAPSSPSLREPEPPSTPSLQPPTRRNNANKVGRGGAVGESANANRERRGSTSESIIAAMPSAPRRPVLFLCVTLRQHSDVTPRRGPGPGRVFATNVWTLYGGTMRCGCCSWRLAGSKMRRAITA